MPKKAIKMNPAVELQLPSGAKIMARKPIPEQLAIWGQYLRMVGLPLEGDYASWSEQQLSNLATVLCQLLSQVYVEPCISLDRSIPGSVHPLDVPKDDWTFVIRWALMGGETKETRRQSRRCTHHHVGRRGKHHAT